MTEFAAIHSPVRWAVTPGLTPYDAAMSVMAREVDAIAEGKRAELIWLLEHPAVLTAGPQADGDHIRAADRFPVFQTDRGGDVTYHGPGQRIVYVMIDVRRRAGGDIRAFVRALESCVIGALDTLGLKGWSDPARPGVWVTVPGSKAGEGKIAALGLRVRRGISCHGLSLNVSPDLEHYSAIVPCGLDGTDVTSLAALGCPSGLEDGMETVDNALAAAFTAWLGPLEAAPAPRIGA